ncbi:MAG: diaminopimelate dehydrogenase [Burkholderiales bacterium]|nr:diaminopimelate dehydrogenase [Burkholderiales bacterium]
MNGKIRVGIAGYGNLGKGVESALAATQDMELVGVFTRRDPAALQLGNRAVPVHGIDAIARFADAVDVLVLCGGSKTDLPEQGPTLATLFNTVDSFDTHAKIPEYFAAMDAAASHAGHVAIISVGWDPGLFSLYRLYGEALLPDGVGYTFWGKGVSQGHSDALRRVPGVRGGVQYTVPSSEAVARVRSGSRPALTTREKHTRDCYVVLEPGADPAAVERAIVTMPDYFADYDTTVTFVSAAELQRDHAAMPHGGFVMRSGTTGTGTSQRMESSLALDSNPEFTASVLVAYARAACRLHRRGERGAKTVFDVAPGLLSPKDAADLRRELL